MKPIPLTFGEHLRATLLVLAIILVLVVASILATGCGSKSGQLTKQPMEKVVVIDSYQSIKVEINSAVTMYKYKVKRIDKGVLTTIYDYDLYEKGDTIYHRFPQ